MPRFAFLASRCSLRVLFVVGAAAAMLSRMPLIDWLYPKGDDSPTDD